MRQAWLGWLMLAGAWAQPQAPPSPAEQQRDLKFTRAPASTVVKPGEEVVIPRSYALVVGISEYQNLPPQGQLRYPARDAAAVYTSLISPEGGQFPPENVHRLIGRNATLANLMKELEEWLPGVSRDEDRVVIYFAGHGFVSGGKAYLAPYDVSAGNIAGTAYPMERLGQVMGSRIKAKWKVLLTDACHSGAITPESEAQQINASLLNLDRSLFSLTASRDREQSFESEIWGGGHGVFTYFVMKGIEGEADENVDGVVTADELGEYVRVNVRRETKTRQNPTAERGSYDPNMILAFNPARAPSAPAQPPKFGRLVIESNMDGVEVFVDGKTQGVVDRNKPLQLPGITPGVHTVQGVRMGYEPDGPREETVYPGQDTTVSLRIAIPRTRKKAAVDEFNEGMDSYQKGFEKNYLKAAEHFQKAMEVDGKYSQAALYLGRVYHALLDYDKARAAFQRALAIDPDYAEAQASFGGMLLDVGDLDGAIRQLTASLQRAPGNSLTSALLAQAFTRKNAYVEGAKYAREAIRLNPGHAEAHFWLAEALRFDKKCPEALGEYREYLKLSDFDSKLAGKLNYYVLGYLTGMGKKKRAAQTDIWKELQFMASFGLCDCERMTRQFDLAVGSCQKALRLDETDLYAHYALALVFTEKFNQSSSAGYLSAAKGHFERVIQINPETVEAERAKKYLGNIQQVVTQLGASTSPP
ncbi:MAG: tetratricopeptide repeat protein [Acidobacteria bacterium]|nr:tetratricopeptide repeat protein [Acidobacteriota bacterium]